MRNSKALTAFGVRNAAPRERPYRLAAGSGMYLEVMPTGAKYWRWNYRHARDGFACGLLGFFRLADGSKFPAQSTPSTAVAWIDYYGLPQHRYRLLWTALPQSVTFPIGR